jgi:hypothetical protein
MKYTLKPMNSFRPVMAAFGRGLGACAVSLLLAVSGMAAEPSNSTPAAKVEAPVSTRPANTPSNTVADGAARKSEGGSAKSPSGSSRPEGSRSEGGSSTRSSKGPAPSNSVPAGKVAAPLDLNWFSFIPQRNIFNPNRRGPVSLNQERPAPRIDSFSLVGVMSYDKGQFAFFDGSSSQFKQALKVGGKIDAYTITEITNSKVKLKTGEKELDFVMGMQMRRENNGEWKVSQRQEPVAAASGSAGPSANADAAPGSALERLLKKRAEEAANK